MDRGPDDRRPGDGFSLQHPQGEGLPPTPIANPGVAALEAALEPAAVDYLYYVLSDTDGHHFFTASYEEFLEAKANSPAQ